MLTVVKPTRLVSYLYSAKLPGFEEILFCDFADEIDSVKLYSPTAWDAVLTALIDNADQSIIVFVPTTSQMTECLRWDDLARVGLLIDEVGRDFLDRSKVHRRLDPCFGLTQALSRTHKARSRDGFPMISSSDRGSDSVVLNSDRGSASSSSASLRQSVSCRSAAESVRPTSDSPPRVSIAPNRLSNSFSRALASGSALNHRRCDVATLLWAVVLLAWEDRLLSLLDNRHEGVAGRSEPRVCEVSGASKVVEKLCQRLREKQQGTCTILYGPSGVGKRTLARLYAKSIMCDAPLYSGMACGRCYNCQGFDHGRFPFGFLEIDTKNGIQQIQAQYAVDDARPDHLAPKRVTILLCIDSYTSSVSDRLLKTLEDGKDVAFLLTVEDLTKVRLAVQSRSEAYRMQPLDFIDSRKRLKEQIDHVRVDEKIMDLLVAGSAGLPGEIRRVANKFRELVDHDLETVRSALGWNWVHDTSELWRVMLEHDDVFKLPAIKPLLMRPTISVQRIQAYLLQIRLVVALVPIPKLGAIEPPFLHCDSQIIRAVADLLCQRASAMAKTPEQLWREVAKIWTDLDILDADDLYQAAHDTRSLVARGGRV